MFIGDVVNSGAIPALEAMVRFAARRQELIAHNIANFSTPNFRPVDASPTAFRRQLAEAIEERRERGGALGGTGPLELGRTREVRQLADGSLEITPRTASGNILFHDRNNRDLERTMQDLAENTAAFRVATDLLRSRYALLRDAMAERVG